MSRWDQISSYLDSAGLQYETVVTEQRNHATSLIQTLDLGLYSAVVTVSGDGLIHEVGACQPPVLSFRLIQKWIKSRKLFPVEIKTKFDFSSVQ